MAQFIVTTLTDEFDGEENVANPAGAGLSLREAVTLANLSSGADEIVFADGLEGVIRLTLGQMNVSDDVTINGGNVITISGDADDDDTTDARGVTDVDASAGRLDDNTRIFTSISDLTLEGLTITGGRTEGNSLFSGFSNQGGAIHVDGAGNTLTIRSSTIAGNSTNGLNSEGGAIYADGDLIISDSTISGNVTQGERSFGGAIYAQSAVTITNTTIAYNETQGDRGYGGALFADGGYVAIYNSTIVGNRALGEIANNASFNVGSAIYSDDDITIHNSIILDNSSPANGGPQVQEKDDSGQGDGAVDFQGVNLLGPDTPDSNDNAIYATSSEVFTGGLRDNGGPVQTIALSGDLSNPALDAATGLATPSDARGVDAVNVPGAGAETGIVRDIGAHEFGNERPSLVVSTLADGYDDSDGQTTLREAIAYANANPSVEPITFLAGLEGTIQLTGGQFTISEEISIEGDVDGDGIGDIAIDAGGASRHFFIDGETGGDLRLYGLTLTNGYSADSGGSILNSGDLSAVNTTFSGNTADYGGAVSNGPSGAFSEAAFVNATFSGNTAIYGGAIDNNGFIRVVNGTFVGNSATDSGGAISNNSDDTAEIYSSTFTGNDASVYGGAIYNSVNGDLFLANSIVLGNSAPKGADAYGPLDLDGANIVGDALMDDGDLISQIDRSDVFASAAGDVGELADNGGPVQTVKINANGPAADAGDGGPPRDSYDVDGDGSETDYIAGANGIARASRNFDLGAYEAVAATRIEVTNVNDSGAGSLRQAIADAGTAPNVFITFADDLAGQTINLQSTLTIQAGAEIAISGDVDGDGEKDVAISGDRTGNGRSSDDVRLFDVAEGGALALEAITLSDGFDRGSDGFLNANAQLARAGQAGVSVIETAGTVVLSSVDITNAYAQGGAGRYVDFDEAFNGSDVAAIGGDAAAILVTGSGDLTVTDSLILGVESQGGNGNIYFPGGSFSGGDGGDGATILVSDFGSADLMRVAFGNNTVFGGDGEDSTIFGAAGGDAAIGLPQTGATLTATKVAGVVGQSNFATGGAGGSGNTADGDDGSSSFLAIMSGTGASAYGNDADNIAGGGEGTAKVILGFGGADTITLGAENDTVFAGDGADEIRLGIGVTSVDGQGGDDLLVVTQAFGTHDVDGGDGSDTLDLSPLTGNALTVDLNETGPQTVVGALSLAITQVENLIGSDGNDMLTGRKDVAGRLEGGVGIDTLTGGDGDDTLLGGRGSGDGADSLFGGGGDDLLKGGFFTDEVFGGDGDDTLEIELDDLADNFDGGDDMDTIVFSTAISGFEVNLATTVQRQITSGGRLEIGSAVNVENLIGSGQDDDFTGDAQRNVLEGRDGDDTLQGGLGDDVLDGGADNDTADFSEATSETLAILLNREGIAQSTLSSGRDVLIGIENLIGSDHNDRLFGDENANRIEGGEGGDTIDGVAGNDSLFGGGGNDGFRARGGQDLFDGGDDTDFVNYAESTGVNAFLNAANGTNGRAAVGDIFTDIENLIGSSTGSDRLFGDAEANRLTGLGGDDTIRGFEGIDQLEGGEGADLLTGDGGADVIITGTGADTIVFNQAPNATERDRITDFESGTDILQIDASVFGGGLVAGQTAVLVANGNPTAATGDATFLYDTDNGTLRFDADGTGAEAAVLFAFLQNVPTIDAGDFEFV
ncbi:MAG: choice-of-anchor Q domain-containing protein [Pseudomonadota bacterium]